MLLSAVGQEGFAHSEFHTAQSDTAEFFRILFQQQEFKPRLQPSGKLEREILQAIPANHQQFHTIKIMPVRNPAERHAEFLQQRRRASFRVIQADLRPEPRRRRCRKEIECKRILQLLPGGQREFRPQDGFPDNILRYGKFQRDIRPASRGND